MRVQTGNLVGRLVAVVCGVGCLVAAGAAEATLRVETSEVRSYAIPADFPLKERVVHSAPDGPTLIANTAGTGETSTCTVIVVTASSARAFPYRHSARGSRCAGVLPHPEGGFFVRGARPDAHEGEVAGFAARIAPDGREQWVVQDTAIAGSDDFRGDYLKPHPTMAYSSSDGQLLAFTLGKLTIGNFDEKQVTHASVLSGGSFEIEAKTLGSSGGFGLVGGVVTLEQSGDFLVYMYQPNTQGARFFVYDGRENVDAFRPLDEDWDDRFVRQLVQGPEGDIYLLWTEQPEPGPTRVTVVDTEGAEVWSEQYEPGRKTGDAGAVALGEPQALWVGVERAIVLYDANGVYLRVLKRTTGEEIGLARLAGATNHQPLDFVHGPEGRLRLLAADSEEKRFRELRLEFEESSAGDAGLGDAGRADGGPDGGLDGGASGGGSGSGGGNGSGGGGCSVHRYGEPAAPGALFVVAFVAVCIRIRDPRS